MNDLADSIMGLAMALLVVALCMLGYGLGADHYGYLLKAVAMFSGVIALATFARGVRR